MATKLVARFGVYRFRATLHVALVYENRVAHATRWLTILRERDIPVTFSLPPSGYIVSLCHVLQI
ncbi:MAG: hypothetical protein OXE52_06345 [Chloroflexi bacterium]|nr:hypothetical protein [Chloroflexota bacterium]